jgi:hypothetical protein
MSSTFEGIRSITGTKRPGGNHGCKLVEVIPNIYSAHFEDISKPGDEPQSHLLSSLQI